MASCYSGLTVNDIAYLKEGSVLTTYSSDRLLALTKLFLVADIIEISRFQLGLPHQSCRDHLFVTTEQNACIATHINGVTYKFELKSTIEELVKEPEQITLKELQRYADFYHEMYKKTLEHSQDQIDVNSKKFPYYQQATLDINSIDLKTTSIEYILAASINKFYMFL